MTRKFIVVITFMMLSYVVSFFLVIAAPCGIFQVDNDWEKIQLVHRIYDPFFLMMHHSDRIRDTTIQFCSITGNLDNFSMLYWMYEAPYMDMD
ncbi:MAG: hypothetical protein KDA70_08945 [Planctomycetaceae bacterium]|nr:hypothetical protein [Planctomycetaceae bacterium]MCA9022119.1 hypothetical protein [Planctomycetaceae bacterium]